MALAYTKEFLLDALCSRYKDCFNGVEAAARAYRDMCSMHYDKVGKDVFRQHASLDAAAIKKFRLESQGKS